MHREKGTSLPSTDPKTATERCCLVTSRNLGRERRARQTVIRYFPFLTNHYITLTPLEPLVAAKAHESLLMEKGKQSRSLA